MRSCVAARSSGPRTRSVLGISARRVVPGTGSAARHPRSGPTGREIRNPARVRVAVPSRSRAMREVAGLSAREAVSDGSAGQVAEPTRRSGLGRGLDALIPTGPHERANPVLPPYEDPVAGRLDELVDEVRQARRAGRRPRPHDRGLGAAAGCGTGGACTRIGRLAATARAQRGVSCVGHRRRSRARRDRPRDRHGAARCSTPRSADRPVDRGRRHPRRAGADSR